MFKLFFQYLRYDFAKELLILLQRIKATMVPTGILNINIIKKTLTNGTV